MRVSGIISISAFGASAVLAQNGTTGQLGDATVVTNNPPGKAVVAKLPEQPFFTTGSINGNVKGSVVAKSGPNGEGVDFEVSFSNIPTEGGPFIYHLHADPVPEDGNCTSTLAHLDPFIRGEDPACDSKLPATCQVGDLSGKYGKITTDSFSAKYHDPYTSLAEGVGSYFANRSVVFHFANKTRITCANFVDLQSNDTGIPSPSGSGAATPPTPTGSGYAVVTAAANSLNVVKNLAIAPVMALLLAL
ncbi:superoxide dismutase [Xylariaceae sp. FL0662B]|nr:superoxide dismutase [Xylariaceae sp. FL0662B]